MNKQTAICICLLSILGLTMLGTANVAVVKAATVPTYAFLTAAPNPVGVNQKVELVMWINWGPPAYLGQQYGWQNYTIAVTTPSGSSEKLGPFTSDPAGTTFTSYTPTQAGTYTFVFNWPGQIDALGTTHQPATSKPISIVVQQQPVAAWQETPLPTNYWSTTVNSQNRGWSTIDGPWLQSSYDAGGGSSNPYNPYTTAPQSAHVVWTKPISFGGNAGGALGSTDYYTGLSYETKFKPPIIINGVLYYSTPDSPKYGFYAVNLQTGQTLWYQNGTNAYTTPIISAITGVVNYPTISLGQLMSYSSGNQHGAYAYLWWTGSSNWVAYDAHTGNYLLTFANATSGNIVYGSSGEMLEYILGPSWLALWNSTVAFDKNGMIIYQSAAAQLVGNGQWRPQAGVYDWTKGIQWNVTTPSYPGQAIIGIDSGVILAQLSPTLAAFFGSAAWRLEIGYSTSMPSSNGAYPTSITPLWVANRTLIAGSTQYNLNGPLGNGVYTEYVQEQLSWYGYSLTTGTKLWGPSTSPVGNDFDYYTLSYAFGGSRAIINGTLLSASYGGTIDAFNIQTGQYLGTFQTASPGLAAPYPNYPFATAVAGADGTFYAASDVSFPPSPLWQGHQLYAINANTQKLVWSINGMYNSLAIADGYLVALNSYDEQVYCFNKGPSKTTVTAPNSIINQGSPILLTGTVTDISPGTQQIQVAANYPNGLPAVSDASQTQFMEAVYMQQQMPNNVTGVTVHLTAIDPNGNFQDIGYSTSNALGNYAISWTPPVPGMYTVTATFDGSDSYYSSQAGTSFVVTKAPAAAPVTPIPSAAPATPTPIQPTPIPSTPTVTIAPTPSPAVTPPASSAPTTTYIAIAAVIIAVIAIAAAIILRRRK